MDTDIKNMQALETEFCGDITRVDQLPQNLMEKAQGAYKWAQSKVTDGYTVIEDTFCPTVPEKQPEPASAAVCFKKFVFAMVKAAQVYLVIEIINGVSVPSEVGPPTTGSLTYFIPPLIFASFITQFLDFALSCAPISFQLIQTNNSLQALITTAIINQLATPNWGAKGEMVTILQNVIKNQALLNTLDFGLINALFPLPNCFLIVEESISACCQTIYDVIFKPVVDAVKYVITVISEFVSYVLGAIWSFIAWLIQYVLDAFGAAARYTYESIPSNICSEDLAPHFKRVKQIQLVASKKFEFLEFSFHDDTWHENVVYGDRSKSSSGNSIVDVPHNDFVKSIEIWQDENYIYCMKFNFYSKKSSTSFGKAGVGKGFIFECGASELGIVGFSNVPKKSGVGAINQVHVQMADGKIEFRTLRAVPAAEEVYNEFFECCGVKVNMTEWKAKK